MSNRTLVLTVISIILIWRVATIAVIIAAQSWLPYRPDAAFTQLAYFTTDQVGQQLSWFSSLANFDGVHYVNIAQRGYVDEGRFFPLFPGMIYLLSQGLHWLTGANHLGLVVGISLAHLFLIISGCLLVKLHGTLDPTTKHPFMPLILLLAFPTSFFLGAVYTESLFLTLILASFWFSRQSRWVNAAVMAALASATRLVGIAVLPALLYEWWQHKKRSIVSLGMLLLVPVGLGMYAWYNSQLWGDWSYFLTAHTQLGNSREVNLLSPLVVIYRYLRIFLTFELSLYEWWIALLEMCMAGFVGFSLWLAWWKKIPTTYLLFAVLVIAIPILSGTLSGFPRYALMAFPLFLGWSRVSPRWQWAYIATTGPLLVILLTLFTRGYFVA